LSTDILSTDILSTDILSTDILSTDILSTDILFYRHLVVQTSCLMTPCLQTSSFHPLTSCLKSFYLQTFHLLQLTCLKLIHLPTPCVNSFYLKTYSLKSFGLLTKLSTLKCNDGVSRPNNCRPNGMLPNKNIVWIYWTETETETKKGFWESPPFPFFTENIKSHSQWENILQIYFTNLFYKFIRIGF
jgi:hypothetical protein